MWRSVMLLLSVMTVSGLPSLSSFTEISLPVSKSDAEHEDIAAPYMDYDEASDDFEDDYDDYDDDHDDTPTDRRDSRARQVIKSCQFIDLTALGPICNTGKKIKYYKVRKLL